VYLFLTSVGDKGEVSGSRVCRFTPPGHIECLGWSHSRSAHLGEEKQILYVRGICARIFGIPPRRLVAIPTELSSYSDFLFGTQITSKIVGFLSSLCPYTSQITSYLETKSSMFCVRQRVLDDRRV